MSIPTSEAMKFYMIMPARVVKASFVSERDKVQSSTCSAMQSSYCMQMISGQVLLR